MKNHTFQELPSQFNVGRYGLRCAFFPNTNKIMITGGVEGSLDSVEILDNEDGSATMASPINSKSCGPGSQGFKEHSKAK